jgi:peptidyl-tRNA hydrolase, PTH1 family
MADLKYCLVGLGNPGSRYHLTRHNVGFFFLDFLAEQRNLSFNSEKLQGLFCSERRFGSQVFYLKPQTFMNRSGECVQSFAAYYKIPLDHILVLQDDIDLPPGRIKVVGRGGAGGHNGIRSLIQYLGTPAFARLKIGIGRPLVREGEDFQPVDAFVLSQFTPDELTLLHQQYDLVQEAVDAFVLEGVAQCMNKINRR